MKNWKKVRNSTVAGLALAMAVAFGAEQANAGDYIIQGGSGGGGGGYATWEYLDNGTLGPSTTQSSGLGGASAYEIYLWKPNSKSNGGDGAIIVLSGTGTPSAAYTNQYAGGGGGGAYTGSSAVDATETNGGDGSHTNDVISGDVSNNTGGQGGTGTISPIENGETGVYGSAGHGGNGGDVSSKTVTLSTVDYSGLFIGGGNGGNDAGDQNNTSIDRTGGAGGDVGEGVNSPVTVVLTNSNNTAADYIAIIGGNSGIGAFNANYGGNVYLSLSSGDNAPIYTEALTVASGMNVANSRASGGSVFATIDNDVFTDDAEFYSEDSDGSGESGESETTINGNLVSSSSINIWTGDVSGTGKSGNVKVDITGNAVSTSYTNIYLGESRNDDNTNVGSITYTVGGNHIVKDGHFDVDAGWVTDATGVERGSIELSIAKNLYLYDDHGGSSTIYFTAGNADATAGKDGSFITAKNDRVVGDNIGALGSGLLIWGGASADAYNGGYSNITVGGSGLTKEQWNTLTDTGVNLKDLTDTLYTLKDGYSEEHEFTWKSGDWSVTAGSYNTIYEDTTSQFGVVVDRISLAGGDGTTGAVKETHETIGGTAIRDNGAYLSLVGDANDDKYSGGQSIYSANGIALITGSGANAGDGVITMTGRQQDDDDTLDVTNAPPVIHSNVYIGDGGMDIYAENTATYAKAGLVGAGRVVFVDDDEDGERLGIRNSVAANNNEVVYDAVATDFTNLNSQSQTAVVDLTEVAYGSNTSVDLGEYRLGAYNVLAVSDERSFGSDMDTSQLTITKMTTSIAGTKFDYTNGEGGDDIFQAGKILGDNAGASNDADYSLIGKDRNPFDYGEGGSVHHNNQLNFEFGADVSVVAGDAENRMLTFVNGVELQGAEVELNMWNIGNPYDAVAVKDFLGYGDFSATQIVDSFNSSNAVWREHVVLIQNGDDEITNTRAFDAGDHILHGDHIRSYQTNDFDLIVALWKGSDGTAAANSQILASYVDARYIKSQSILQNRIAAIGQMNSVWDNNWNFLDSYAGAKDQCGGWGVFADAGYTKSWMNQDTGRYDSKSKVDAKSWHAIAGLHYRSSNDCNSGFFGAAFFEGSWGKFNATDVYDLSGQGVAGALLDVRGRGGINQYGGGIYLRAKTYHGLKVQGALRAGFLDTDYRTTSVTEISHTPGINIPKFDIDSAYIAASAGLSWEIRPNDCNVIEPFVAYHWTHLRAKNGLNPYGYLGNNVVDDQISTMNVKSMNSHRVQGGVKYSYAFSRSASGSMWKGYAGAALEYEFAGKARSSMWYGTNVPAAHVQNDTLDGLSGVGQLGIRYEAASRWFLDVGAHGSFGKRRSIGGSVGVGTSF